MAASRMEARAIWARRLTPNLDSRLAALSIRAVLMDRYRSNWISAPHRRPLSAQIVNFLFPDSRQYMQHTILPGARIPRNLH